MNTKPPIKPDYEIDATLAKRWSPRAFSEKKVDKKVVLRLLEAARWAASCFNEQPWYFIIGYKGDNTYDNIFDCLVEGNKAWNMDNTQVLMLTVAKKTFDHNDKENRHYFHDVGLAMGNFTYQATKEGLFLHQMAGFDAAQAAESFEIPDNYEPVAAVALGYLGTPDDLPEKYKDSELKPQSRNPVKYFAFSGTWGKSFI